MQSIKNKRQFEEIFNLHFDELCRVVYPILNDTAAAEDAVQDVFVKLWLNRAKTEINTSFKAYLYKAVVLRALDFLRKQKHIAKAGSELKATTDASHRFTEQTLEASELETIIKDGIDQLSPNVKTIFRLSRFSGLKNREIAEHLDISIKTVESNIGKALKQMKEHLQPYLDNGAIALLLSGLLQYIFSGG